MRSFFFLCLLVLCNALAAAELKPGTTYTVTQLDGQAIPRVDGLAAPTITLDATGKQASGTSGINRYGGGCTMQDGTLTITQPFSTMMAGSEEAMKVEQQFLRIIAAPLKIEVAKTGKTDLVLTGTAGSLLLTSP